MQLEEQVKKILFDLGKNIKLHRITNESFIFEIDYERYAKDIVSLLEQTEPESRPQS
jgi:hypothetical protein